MPEPHPSPVNTYTWHITYDTGLKLINLITTHYYGPPRTLCSDEALPCACCHKCQIHSDTCTEDNYIPKEFLEALLFPC